MAQQPARGGLRWVKSLAGDADSPPVEIKVVASAYGTAIFRGDPVKAINDGTVEACAANEAISHVVLGVVEYLDSDSVMRPGTYLPASTTYTGGSSLSNPFSSKLICIPVNNQVFEVDVVDAAASAAAALGYIGNCIDIIATAGSTLTGRSGYTTAAVSTFAGSTAQLKLIDIPRYGWNGELNDPTTTYWKGLFTVYEQVGII